MSSVPFLQPPAGNSDSSPSTPLSHRLPTAKQALTRVYSEDDNKRAGHTSRLPHHRHRHTHSLGLPSPTASTSSSSFISLISPEGTDVPQSSSSSNSFSSSPASSQYHLPQPQRPHEATSTSSIHNTVVDSPVPTRSHTTPTPLSSSSQGRPRTPPVRSPTTPTPTLRPRPSPLVQRLLQPFGRASLPSTPTTSFIPSPTSPLNSRSSSGTTMAAIHHPVPQAHSSQASYEPPSPTNTTSPHHSQSQSQGSSHQQRPSSRSERLLRDALLRDEVERHVHGPSPLASGSLLTGAAGGPTTSPVSPPRGHKRRHSHVPTSSTPTTTTATTTTATPRKVQDSEEYIRGSTMFRTAMSNPRSVSPPLHGYYGGDAEGSPITGVMSRTPLHQPLNQQGRHWDPSQHQQQHQPSQTQGQGQTPHTPRRHDPSQPQQASAAAAATTRSASASARSTSHSPSPLGRRNQIPLRNATESTSSRTPASPRSPPLPSSGLQRHHTVHVSPSSLTPQQSPSGTAGGRQRSTTTGVKSRPPPIDLFSSSSSSGSGSALQQQQQRQIHQAYHQSQAHVPPFTSPPAPGHTSGGGPRNGSARGVDIGPGEPLMMTPHEQVLRARLERVLEQGRVIERHERRKSAERGRSEGGGSVGGSRSGSSRRGGMNPNEVRDEEGGWPWRDAIAGRSGKASAPSVTSSGQYSSPSTGSSGSKPPTQSPFLNAFSQPPRTSSDMHKRTRSKTDPVSPPPVTSASAAPSPRRSSTAPSPAFVGGGTPSKISHAQHQRTGTTPPLMPEAEGEGEVDGESRLLTPPPTPPFTARIFSFSTPQRDGHHAQHQRAVTLGGGGGEYVPSPYKTGYQQQQGQPGKKGLSGLGMGVPPLSSRKVQSSEEDDDASSSCSSNHHSNSQASFPSSSHSSHSPLAFEAPISPPVNRLPQDSRASRSRPSFNARKASVQCRAMEGYVSFATVEGLGEPPAAPGGGDDDAGDSDDADANEKRGRERGLMGIGASWGGWRKLLGVASGGAGVNQKESEAGVVL